MLKTLRSVAPVRTYATVASANPLRAAFDDHRADSGQLASTSKALFGYDNLKQPSDLGPLAQRTVHRASAIVKRIRGLPDRFAADGTSANEALLTTAKQFDRLSDLLCSVIDPCEFIRNVHEQPEWIQAANATFEYMWNYMNQLNTDTELYRVRSDFSSLTVAQCLHRPWCKS
jgi:intermediate peptidase